MAKRKSIKKRSSPKKASSRRTSPAKTKKVVTTGKIGGSCYSSLWLIILGILIILNGWRVWLTWPQFIGTLVIIWGLSKYACK